MITEKDLQEAIAECEGQRNPNANTCIKLAAFYTIKKELFGEPPIEQAFRGYSGSMPASDNEIEYDSGTEFSDVIKGKELSKIMPVLDELVTTVQALHPRMYESFIDKIIEA